MERWIRLDLKLTGDVGVIGLPNAGKSTLLSRVTAATPKIASYPFTTIVPNLGVCDLPDSSGLVLCDVPGLIRDASSGAGMGHRFLRHVQRNKILLHVLDGTADDVVENFRTINEELRKVRPRTHIPRCSERPAPKARHASSSKQRHVLRPLYSPPILTPLSPPVRQDAG